MDQAIKTKWVKALRSGEYAQGRDYLVNDGKYCCLGVLAKVMGKSEEFLDGKVLFRTGDMLTGTYHVLSGAIQNALADCNDAEVPFEMIAGLIDEAL